ncbi:MAG: hypothetical protein ACLF0G_09035 [Candidatus Brocadiia bacterium]
MSRLGFPPGAACGTLTVLCIWLVAALPTANAQGRSQETRSDEPGDQGPSPELLDARLDELKNRMAAEGQTMRWSLGIAATVLVGVLLSGAWLQYRASSREKDALEELLCAQLKSWMRQEFYDIMELDVKRLREQIAAARKDTEALRMDFHRALGQPDHALIRASVMLRNAIGTGQSWEISSALEQIEEVAGQACQAYRSTVDELLGLLNDLGPGHNRQAARIEQHLAALQIVS